MASKPNIVFVDDNPEQLSPFANQLSSSAQATAHCMSPDEIDIGVLVDAHLVVVDYTIDGWIDNQNVTQIALKPINGVALAAVLREHAEKRNNFPPTGFALITGKADALGPLPKERRPHIVSRLNNVEWFFEKGTADHAKSVAQMLSLAQAIADIPEAVGKSLGDIDALVSYLGIHDDPLRGRLARSVQFCRPPIHHLAEWSHGLIIIRWLLHRILSHATFLFDNAYLANRLSLTRACVDAALSGSVLRSLLEPAQYRGPLSEFDGERWWREQVEQILWDATEGQSADASAIHTWLNRSGITDLEPITVRRPVLTLDENLQVESRIVGLSDAIAVQLDDWPSYAEPAFMRKSLIEEHPHLKMYMANGEFQL